MGVLPLLAFADQYYRSPKRYYHPVPFLDVFVQPISVER
jgi:hypothetical protein